MFSSHLLLELHHVQEVLRTRRQASSHFFHQILHLLQVYPGATGQSGLQLLQAQHDATNQNAASARQREQLRGNRTELYQITLNVNINV